MKYQVWMKLGVVVGSIMFVGAAHASYATEWRPVASTRVMYSVLKRPMVANTAEQAAQLGASVCGPEVEALHRQGHLVTALRGVAVPTPSPYIFGGNCDVQVISR